MSSPSLDSLLQIDKESTSFDISDDEDLITLEPWEILLHRLSTKHLEHLKEFFKDEIENKDLQLNKEEFVYAIDTVLGNSKYSLQAISLYNEIPHPDEEKVTWNQLIDYYIAHGVTEQYDKVQFSAPEIFIPPHVKTETIIKIVSIETDTSFCYAIISKYGRIGVYTGGFNLLQKYQAIFTRCDRRLAEKSKKIRTIFVTDALFLPEVNILVVSNSARNLVFYDVAGQKHIPLFLIEGLPNVIHSLEYFSDFHLKLFLGDDCGTITTITFLQQKDELFRRKHNDRLTHYYWIELPDETNYIHIDTFKKIHSNTVLKMFYYPEAYSIVSCSRDSKNSVVFFNLKERKKSYTFKIAQGVCCFSVNHQLHILLTGDNNGSIQLWNLYVSSKAITVFQGHKSGIIDVQIFESKNVAVTISRDGVLKVWNLLHHFCDQTLPLQFPSFEVLGKFIEWGASTIYPGPKRLDNMQSKENIYQDNGSNVVQEISDEREIKEDIWQRYPILITCCSYIAKLSIQIDEENNFSSNILPPPPLQNEIIIPEDWKINAPQALTTENDTNVIETENDTNVTETENDTNVIEMHPLVKSIMERDFLKKYPRCKHDINYKIAALEYRKMEMMKPVSQCAPYLALELHEIEEVKLSLDLPVPRCKKIQQIVDKTQRLLSAASARSEILSDRSSKSKSSRSSIVEF